MDRTEENLKRIRALDTKGYPDDPNPDNWKTINGSHVHLDENGNYDGGAQGKFNKKHHWGPGWQQKNQSVGNILSILGNLGKKKQVAQQPKPMETQKPGEILGNLANATQPPVAPTIDIKSKIGKTLAAWDKKHKKYGFNHTDAINAALASAPQDFQALWSAYSGQLVLANASKKGTAYYKDGVGVSLSLKETADGVPSHKKPYQTWFHEFGHHLDSAAGIKGEYLSNSYQGGIFDQTIRAEVKAMIDAEYYKIKQESPGLGKPGWYAQAQANISQKIWDLPDYQKNCLSDIFGGCTKNKVLDGWKHATGYWSDSKKLAREAFAHFCETMTVNPDGYEVMKKWLPKSEKIFREMIAEAVKQKA